MLRPLLILLALLLSCSQLAAQTLVADTLLLQNWDGTGFYRQPTGPPIIVLEPGVDSLYGFQQYNNRSDSYQNLWAVNGRSGVNAGFNDVFRRFDGTDTTTGILWANRTPDGEHGAHLVTAQFTDQNYTANGYHRQAPAGQSATSSVGFYGPSLNTQDYEQILVRFWVKVGGQVDNDFGALRYSINATAPPAPLPNGSGATQPDDYWTYAIPNGGDLVGGAATPAPGLEYQICNEPNRFVLAKYTLPDSCAGVSDLRICFWWQNNNDGIGQLPGFSVDDIVVIGLRRDTSFVTEALPKDTFCLSEVFNVDYSINPGVITTDTGLVVLLSDATGDFTNADTIGTGTYTAGTSGGTLQSQIPLTTAPGTGYRVRVVAASGDTARISPTIATIPNIDPPTISLSLPDSLCPQTAELALNEDPALFDSFQWWQNDVPVPGADQPQYTAAAAGSYQLQAGVGVCNLRSNTVAFAPASAPTVTTINSDAVLLCAEDTLTLPVLPQALAFWGLSAAPGLDTVFYVYNTDTITSINAPELGPGIYPILLRFRAANGCEVDPIERNLLVPNSPNPVVSTVPEGVTDIFSCFEDNVVLTVDPAGDDAVLWSNGAIRASQSPNIQVDTVGTYSAQISLNGCTYLSDTLTVASSASVPAPTITLLEGSQLSGRADYFNGTEVLIFEGSQQNLIGTTTLLDSAWSFNVPGIIPNNYIFWARLRIDANCDGVVDASDLPGPFSNAFSAEFLPPTLITPDGDGSNDVFVFGGSAEDPTGLGFLSAYPNARLTVYSRWGLEVFDEQPYQNDWDGGDAPAGTYYYILAFGDDSREDYKGYVTIRR